MNHLYLPLALLLIFSACNTTDTVQNSDPAATPGPETSITAPETDADLRRIGTGLEPWTYRSDFSDRTLGAWASYPHWQDIAYNQNFRTNELVPRDPNVSLVQLVTPYSNVDNYAGAQKKLDMYLVPGASISFRYYLKTSDRPEYLKVRFAAGDYGKLDVTVPAPETNRWVWVTVDYDDFVRENPQIAGQDRVRTYVLAFLAKIPMADPDMPIYLGLDDIVYRGARPAHFRFAEPAMHKLPEFNPYIPERHYYRGDRFRLSGDLAMDADRIGLEIVRYTHRDESVYRGELRQRDGRWVLPDLRLDFPEGLYLGRLTARDAAGMEAETEFTIHIAPRNIGGQHPRLMFNREEMARVEERLQTDRFRGVYENILETARNQREQIPVESLIYDLNQFPDEDWLPTWSAWGSRIYHTGNTLRNNARAYAFHGDQEAGEYVRDVLVRLAGWPDWTHPWQTKRGRYSEHRTGSWAHRVAEAYDLIYDVMSEDERTTVRKAIMRNIVKGAHRTYVYNDNVTGNTSNWLAMILGGSLMNMAAMFQDGPDTENLEPYFTGAVMKYYNFINSVTDSEDGAWGEGFGYNNYSFSNMAYSVPSLMNVYNIDVTDPLVGTYKEFIWGGILRDRRWFEYGDSGYNINNVSNWAFLLHYHREPLLSWWYNYIKYGDESGVVPGEDRFAQHEAEVAGNESYLDVLFDTDSVEPQSAYEMDPVDVFRQVGTTVFKSGWDSDDFVFNMRTGPFYNHQHHEQGTFWLADRGETFILGNRPLSNTTYYDDPLYQPWYTAAVGASTILIDGNKHGQRVGDHHDFAPGFHDHAFIDHFLNGGIAAFSTGDIGRLYWGEVESLRRNVLYLKPSTILMLDTAMPGYEDRDVTLLYQVQRYDDIRAGQERSTITRGDAVLHIEHLAPSGSVKAEAVRTPHYLFTLRRERPLEWEGMLTVTARTEHTSGHPLVMANLFSTTEAGGTPDVRTREGEGYVAGTASGRNFVFSTRPGRLYSAEGVTTDALAFTREGDIRFAAEATDFRIDGRRILRSDVPVTFEQSGDRLSYYRSEGGRLEFGSVSEPSSVELNGESVEFRYDNRRRTVVLDVPAGEGEILLRR